MLKKSEKSEINYHVISDMVKQKQFFSLDKNLAETEHFIRKLLSEIAQYTVLMLILILMEINGSQSKSWISDWGKATIWILCLADPD